MGKSIETPQKRSGPAFNQSDPGGVQQSKQQQLTHSWKNPGGHTRVYMAGRISFLRNWCYVKYVLFGNGCLNFCWPSVRVSPNISRQQFIGSNFVFTPHGVTKASEIRSRQSITGFFRRVFPKNFTCNLSGQPYDVVSSRSIVVSWFALTRPVDPTSTCVPDPNGMTRPLSRSLCWPLSGSVHPLSP